MSDPVVVNVGSNIGPALITAGAIILSALGAGIAAYKTIQANRRLTRLRATLDVILESEEDNFYQKLSDVFCETRDGPGILTILNAKTTEEIKTKREIQAFLNHYELICLSIKRGILDEKFYRDWMRRAVVEHWNDVGELVAQLREGNTPLAFEHFEDIAVKWGGRRCRVLGQGLLSE